MAFHGFSIDPVSNGAVFHSILQVLDKFTCTSLDIVILEGNVQQPCPICIIL